MSAALPTGEMQSSNGTATTNRCGTTKLTDPRRKRAVSATKRKETQMSNERETRGADSVQRPCSAEMELADQLEMSALQHADNGEADYGKPLMDAAFALRRLSTALVDANDLCRSAWQISERDGKETGWKNFRDCLGESLERQHRVMYPPNDPSSATTPSKT